MLNSSPARTASGVALSAIVAGGLLLAPTAATAATAGPAASQPLHAQTAAMCEVTEADLSWGVKESFRSYISGSIANGEWTTDNGAEYETPNFLWHSTEGEIAEDITAGSLPFAGSLHFTGHDGLLRMDLANPLIEFDENGSAYLSLDIGATDEAPEGEPTSEQVRAAKIETAGALEADGETLTLTDAPVILTSEGANALNGEYGSYAAGDEMDAITLTAMAPGCAFGAVAVDEEPTAEPEPTETPVPAAEAAEIPWIPIIIGGVALLVIAVTAGMLIGGRKRKPGSVDGQESTPVDNS